MSEQLFKVMLAGDPSTGKTSFLTQLIYQVPDRNPKTTDSLAFFALRLTNPDATLQIWDSPGDPRFKYQVISALAGFRAVLIFVDVTNDFTLHRARTFIEELRSYTHLQIHLVESKGELTVKNPHKRKVSAEDLKALAASVGGLSFVYSRGEAVEPIFQAMVSHKGSKASKKVEVEGVGAPVLGHSETNDTACECELF